MKAVDKRPAVWRVEPGTVRALLPANVLVEPSDLVPQDHPPPGRRVRKEQAVRTESVGNRIDDHPVASRAIGRRQDLLIFLHDAQVAVEKLQDPWHDRLEALVSACFPVGDKGLERVRRDGREGSVRIVDDFSAQGVGKAEPPARAAVSPTTVRNQPFQMPGRRVQKPTLAVLAVQFDQR